MQLCDAEWNPIPPITDADTYGVEHTDRMNDCLILTGYAYDDGWTQFQIAADESIVPPEPAGGMFEVSVGDDGSVEDFSTREFLWWPRHPDGRPVTLPSGKVTLEFNAWSRYGKDRYGAAELHGELEGETVFVVYVPRAELPDGVEQYKGMILGGELAGINPT